MIRSKIILMLVIAFAFTFYSCTKTKEETKVTPQTEIKRKENHNSAGIKENDVELNVQYFGSRRIYKIEKTDLNHDGNNEIIVLSVQKDTSEKYNDYYNFDMVEVFTLDAEKKSYTKIL